MTELHRNEICRSVDSRHPSSSAGKGERDHIAGSSTSSAFRLTASSVLQATLIIIEPCTRKFDAELP